MRHLFTKKQAIGIALFASMLSACNPKSHDETSKSDSTNVTKQTTDPVKDTISELKRLGLNPGPKKATIAPGQTLTVTSSTMIFPYLVMGDNSKLLIDPNLDRCEITIWNGQFGENTEIVADGRNGSNAGPNPQDPWIVNKGWWQAGTNTDGQQGVTGLNGGNAGKGVTLVIKLGITSLKTLTIHANGGQGGNGSNGGTGEYGGRKHGLSGRHGYGGHGGPGGDAGNGGNGGDILVQYWLNNNTIPDPSVQQFIAVNAAPGLHGTPGSGGGGGAIDGGGAAPFGSLGSSGSNGIRGLTKVPERIPKPTTMFAIIDSAKVAKP